MLVDVTIGWQPLPELRVFARYSLFDQFGSPPVGDVPAVLPDLTRNLVMVGVNVTYPAVAALRAPLRGASRVDETDHAGFRGAARGAAAMNEMEEDHEETDVGSAGRRRRGVRAADEADARRGDPEADEARRT